MRGITRIEQTKVPVFKVIFDREACEFGMTDEPIELRIGNSIVYLSIKEADDLADQFADVLCSVREFLKSI